MNIQQYLMQNYPGVESVTPISQNGNVVGYFAKGVTGADSIYVPVSAVNNPSVKMLSYFPGAGGSDRDAQYLREKIQTSPPNYIVTIAAECSDHNNCMDTGYRIANGLNGNVSDNLTMCFSASGDVGLYNTAKFLTEHPNVKSTVLSCEPYRGCVLKMDKLGPLAQTNTPVIFACPDTGFHMDMERTLAELKKYGIDGYKLGTFYGDGHHMKTNDGIINCGLLDYILGESDSFDTSEGGENGFSFYKYDPSLGKLIDADFAEIAGDALGIPNLDKLLSYDGHNIEAQSSPVNNKYSSLKSLPSVGSPELVTFSSEFKQAYEPMNAVRNQVRSSAFLGGVVNLSYRSTADIPGCINDYVNNYFDAVGSLVNSLSMETESVVSYAEAIVRMDNELAQDINKGKTGRIVLKDNSNKKISLGLDNVPENGNSNDSPTGQYPQEQGYAQPAGTGYASSPSGGGSSGGGSSGGGSGRRATPVVPVTKNKKKKDDTTKKDSTFERKGPCYDEDREPDHTYKFDDYEGYIYEEDGKIVGIKYRYSFEDEEECKKKLEEIKEKYKDADYVKDIYLKDNYIDIIFDEDVYKDKTIDEIKDKYFEGGEEVDGESVL